MVALPVTLGLKVITPSLEMLSIIPLESFLTEKLMPVGWISLLLTFSLQVMVKGSTVPSALALTLMSSISNTYSGSGGVTRLTVPRGVAVAELFWYLYLVNLMVSSVISIRVAVLLLFK